MSIALSPWHHVQLSTELAYLLESPPDHDLVIRTLSRKVDSNDRPLVQGDLVLAGKDTLEQFPRTGAYPVHFRKTYFPGSFHSPATVEAERQEQAAKVLAIPEPLGADERCFRSCFIPGTPIDRLSPFGLEPSVRNLKVVDECETGLLLGLWSLAENVHVQLKKLHRGGIAHGDLFLHNVIVSRSPVGVYLIDFANAQLREAHPEGGSWERVCQNDLEEVYRLALWLQCGLGQQPTALGRDSAARASTLEVEHGERILEVIGHRSLL